MPICLSRLGWDSKVICLENLRLSEYLAISGEWGVRLTVVSWREQQIDILLHVVLLKHGNSLTVPGGLKDDRESQLVLQCAIFVQFS